MYELKFRVFTSFSPNHEMPTMGYFNLKTIKASELRLLQTRGFYVQRCTGVKDKVGKEIWEGDIVKQGYVDTLDEELNATIANRIGTVYWAEDHGGFAIEWPYEQCSFTLAFPNLEVIGNIHETPELVPPL